MTSATQKNISRLPRLLGAFLLSLSVLLGFQGCSSGGGSSAPVVPQDSNPVGYFTGTATLNGDSQNDMVGMAYANRLMVFSASDNVLFDIAMSITLTDFTGTVDVYTNGVITGTGVTVSGTTTNSQIQGTFAGGSGLSSGSFDILFDTNNNIGATLARSESVVADTFLIGLLKGIDADGSGLAQINSTGAYTIGDLVGELCENSGGANLVIPDANVNIYQLSHDVILQIGSGGTCTSPYASTGHTGFASVIAKSVDKDTFVFSYANGNVALFSDGLTR